MSERQRRRGEQITGFPLPDDPTPPRSEPRTDPLRDRIAALREVPFEPGPYKEGWAGALSDVLYWYDKMAEAAHPTAASTDALRAALEALCDFIEPIYPDEESLHDLVDYGRAALAATPPSAHPATEGLDVTDKDAVLDRLDNDPTARYFYELGRGAATEGLHCEGCRSHAYCRGLSTPEQKR